MEHNFPGLFIFISLAAFAATQVTDLCPFNGEWKYHSSTGTCVGLQSTVKRYLDANLHCQNFIGGGRRNILGHLVFIFDKETDDFVKDLVKTSSVPCAMIGLNDRAIVGAYRWGETQKELGKDDYRGWATGRPSDNSKSSVVITETGWKELDLYATAFFVCQVDAVLPIPTIKCPPSEVGQRSSKFTCVIEFPDSLVPSDLRFQTTGLDVNECTSQRCQVDDGYESSMEANTTWVSSVLQIKKVQRNHEGNWTCSVKFTNGQMITSEPCGLQVYTVPPTVTCDKTFAQAVMNVSCRTGPMYPKALCQWGVTRGANSQEPPGSSSTVSVQEEPGGEIFYRAVCNAFITSPLAGAYQFRVAVFPSVKGLDGIQPATVKTGSLDVVVEPPPNDQPQMYTSSGVRLQTPLRVTENQTLSITCRTSGGTPEVFRTHLACFGQQSNVTTTSVASSNMFITKDAHETSCSCYGRHVTGTTRMTVLTFKVLSPPRVLTFTINQKDNVTDVEQDAEVSLRCTATGYPPFQLSLLHDQGGEQTLKTVSSYEVSYIMTATCHSMGRYTCLAKGNNQQDVKHVNLRVRCGPVHCLTTKQKPEFEIDVGSNKTAKMCVLAYPAPKSFKLFKGNSVEVMKTRYEVSFNYTDETTGRGEITLTLLSVRQQDLHDYNLFSVFRQTAGGSVEVHSYIQFKLLEIAPPSCPNNLTVSATFPDSITLSWKPGFDGGLQQSFTILRYDSGSTVESQPIPEPARGLENEMSYNVTGLSGSTTYTFGLRAENEKGVTECGLRVHGFTLASPLSSSNHSPNNLTLIVVIAVLVLILMVTVVAFVFVLVGRRRSRGVALNTDTVLTPTRLVRSSSRDDERVAYETIDDTALTEGVRTTDTVQTATSNGRPSSRNDEQNAYETGNGEWLPEEVPHINTTQTPASNGRPSNRREEQNAYETPKGGWLPEEKRQKPDVQEGNNQESVYLNTQNHECSNTVVGADQGVVYANAAASDKIVEGNTRARECGGASNYDCLTLTENAFDDDGTYTKIKGDKVPAGHSQNEGVNVTEKSLYIDVF